jgi:hypothetical protein
LSNPEVVNIEATSLAGLMERGSNQPGDSALSRQNI